MGGTPRPVVVLLAAVAILVAIAGASTQGVGHRDRSSPAARAASPGAEASGLARSKPGAAAHAAPGDRVIVPPLVFDGLPAPSTPPPAALAVHPTTAEVPAGGVWAVIIGINDYPGTRADLRSAVADASDVDAALARYGVPPERRLVLTDGQAPAATITAALDWLVDHAAVDATAVLFYAGHVRKLDGDTEAIVGADGDLVRDVEVARRLARLRARRAWIALAACYGGGFTETLAPGRVLTAAADADSLAYENATYGRSYLVEYMVRRAMLQGAADSSIERAFAWAVDNLGRDRPDRVPFQIDHADGDLVLGVPSAPPAPAPPPAPEPPAPEPPPAEPEPAGDDDGPPPVEDEPPGEDGSPAGDDCVVRLGLLVTCPDR